MSKCFNEETAASTCRIDNFVIRRGVNHIDNHFYNITWCEKLTLSAFKRGTYENFESGSHCISRAFM